MVVADCGSEVPPSIVVVANVSETTRLADTAVDVEVSVSDVSSNTKTADGVTAIGVDSFDVHTVIGVHAVGVEVP